MTMEMIRKQKMTYEYNLELIKEKNIYHSNGKKTNRKYFKITKNDVGKLTVSLGFINKPDVGRVYVIDNDKTDYIVDRNTI